jgi:mRNA interferase MazF
LKPGDVVVGVFPGAETTKARPAVVLSIEPYQRHRPDIVLGLITTQPPKEMAPTDCEVQDWKQAGLHQPSYFTLFPVTFPQREVRRIGRLSDADWEAACAWFKAGVETC